MGSPIPISSDDDNDSDFDFDTDDESISTNLRAEGNAVMDSNLEMSSPQVAMGSSNRSFIPVPYSQIDDPQRSFSNYEYQKHSMEQLGKRALPHSFTSSSNTAPHNYRNGERGHQINGSGMPYPLAGPRWKEQG